MIYSTMEGIVPSRCRLTTRHLGATLFKLRLYQICKSHVTASMHHDTWGLMQSHFFGLIEDPTHHIIMSRPLGATNCSCQQFKVHKFSSIILKDRRMTRPKAQKAGSCLTVGRFKRKGMRNIILQGAKTWTCIRFVLEVD